MPTQPCIERNSKAAVRSTFTSPLRLTRPISSPRSLSDINFSTAANDPRPSASFSARKNPQRIPANTPPVFPGLRPRIWPHLLRLVTKAMSDRLLTITHYRRCGIKTGDVFWLLPDLAFFILRTDSQIAGVLDIQAITGQCHLTADPSRSRPRADWGQEYLRCRAPPD